MLPRFPKLMQDLGGKTVILRTYEAAVHTYLFDDVFVVTDSDLIFDEVSGGKAIRSIKEHESGVINCGSCFESRSVL
jgi:3-deoxy-manno-octulosonate cytidylyltransferase (CMP-KDO synthetase)